MNALVFLLGEEFRVSEICKLLQIHWRPLIARPSLLLAMSKEDQGSPFHSGELLPPIFFFLSLHTILCHCWSNILKRENGSHTCRQELFGFCFTDILKRENNEKEKEKVWWFMKCYCGGCFQTIHFDHDDISLQVWTVLSRSLWEKYLQSTHKLIRLLYPLCLFWPFTKKQDNIVIIYVH